MRACGHRQLLQVPVEDSIVPRSPQGHVDALGAGVDVALDLLGGRVGRAEIAPSRTLDAIGPQPCRAMTSLADVPSLERAKIRLTVRRIVAGSRPNARQWSSSTPIKCRIGPRIRMPCSSRRRGGPRSGACDARRCHPPRSAAETGAAPGRHEAFSARKYRPRWVVRGSVRRLRMSGTASSSMSSRVPAPGKSIPVRFGLPLVPAGAEPQLESAAGDVVDGRGHLGQQTGIAVGDAEHQAAEPGLPGIGGQGAEGRHGLEVIDRPARGRGLVQVVPDRDPVHARVVEPPPQRPQIGHGRFCWPICTPKATVTALPAWQVPARDLAAIGEAGCPVLAGRP